MSQADDLQERLIGFAVIIIKLCAKLPKDQVGCHIAGQLLRSGTSAAPNYAEARGAESRKDFLHKLRIALKELNETWVWLAILEKSHVLKKDETRPVAEECDELKKIIGASIHTIRKNK
jgi:four helix bundle protein